MATMAANSEFDGRTLLGVDTAETYAPTESVGAPGFAVFSGYVVNPERDQRLQGAAKYVSFSDMLANTAIVAAGVRYFVNLVAKATWTVQPADESSEAEALAERINTIMNGMTTPWHRVIRRAAMSRFYGFSIQEWTMRVVDEDDELEGTVFTYQDIEPRPQRTIERWDTDRSGTVLGVVQRSPQTQEEIYLPRAKLVYLVDDTLDDSPEGLGLFRHVIKLAKKLDRYEILEGWGFERDLRGTPVARGPLTEIQKLVAKGDLTNAQALALKNPLETWISNALKGKDTALFLDSAPYRASGENQQPASTYQWDLQLLQGDGGPHVEIAAAIERLNREMARVLGVEQLLLGSDSAGSFALSRDKTQSFGLLVDATLREIREVFEKDFLNPLFELNGWDTKLKPTFQTSQAQYRDIGDITTALKDMAAAGAPLPTNDPAINEVRNLLGLSDQEEQDEDLMIPPMLPGQMPIEVEEEEEIPEVEEE